MRNSFVLHHESVRYIRMLPPDQQLKVYDFLCDFSESDGTAQLPKIDAAADIVLDMITRRMLADFESYREKCQINRENGKKGGRPKKPNGFEENRTETEKPNGFEENQPEPKKPYIDSDLDSDLDSEVVCESRKSNAHTPPTIEAVEAEYNRLCSEHKVTPIPGEAERLFSEYLHRSKSWKAKLRDFVAEDIKQGKYAGSGSKRRKSGRGYADYANNNPEAYDEDVVAKVQAADEQQQELSFE